MKKRIRLSFLLFFISGTIFLSSSFYWVYRERLLKSAVDEKKLERESVEGRIHSLKEEITLNRSILKGEEISLERLTEAQDSLYSFSDLNNFVASFEKVRGEYRGISKASYDIRDKEGEITINLTYNESYINLRRFIYELESRFYFLNISYLKIQKEKDFVRGNMGINVYFRGEKDR